MSTERVKPKKLAAIIITVSMIVVAWFVFWAIRDDLPTWSIIFCVAIVAYFAMATWLAYQPSKDELLAQELAALPDAVLRQGTVLSVKHQGLRETERLRETSLLLEVGLDGVEQSIKIPVRVEDARLPGFTTGSVLHLLQDPRQPERIAIDRRKSPTHIE